MIDCRVEILVGYNYYERGVEARLTNLLNLIPFVLDSFKNKDVYDCVRKKFSEVLTDSSYG